MSSVPVVHQHSSVAYNYSTDCGNIDNSKTNNYNISIFDKKPQILEWLSPFASRERHQDVRDARVDGVGDWLLRTETFSTWHLLQGWVAKPVLLCYGGPGVGKTYFSSLVIDTLCRKIDGDNTAITYVYCDFSAGNAQSTRIVLGSVLRQLVGALAEIPDEVQRAFERAKKQVDGCGLRRSEILDMLVESLSNLKQSFICIDALDEFPSQHRPELWQSLQRLVQHCPNTRLFLTGRPHIQEEAGRYFPKAAEMLSISSSPHDIGLYLEMRLGSDPEFDAMDERLRADILRIIPEKISGIFLLVSLTMDAILAGVTTHERSQVLHRMSNGLGLQNAYNTTLNRIRQQGGSRSKFGMQTLMWISHCERPLKSEELCHALGVELGAKDFKINNVLSIRSILGFTLGLVTIDKKASTLHLLHHSLQEYLRQHPTLFITSHSMMAEICLTYLNFFQPGDATLGTPSFLEYATCFWGTHAAGEVTKTVISLSLRLLEAYENQGSATILWRKKIRESYREQDVWGISGLHCIAFWGIAEIGAAMLETKRWDVNQRDSRGNTPLMWALKYGKDIIAKLFLEQKDIKPDAALQHGRTVFSFAAEWGNESIVKLLLERADVNPNSSDNDSRTPLSFAARNGHEGIVKLLLERGDVDPNSFDNGGQTPLSFAIQSRNEGVLKLFLERGDVDPNSSEDGRTPLSIAAELGNEGIVKLLLERGDVDPNSLDNSGRTPLSFAVRGRHEGVVKLLLERGDIDPNPLDDGRTPLSTAAELGNEGIVRLLLERGDVDSNSLDNSGRTPLSFALRGRHEGVVKILLEHGDVDPNPSDGGRTPLSIAAELGNEGTVKLLLERGDVDPNSFDNGDRTSLSFAVRGGNEGVVKLLLGRGSIDLNPSDGGRAPLSIAAELGNEGAVKLLLERGDVDPNSSDDGRTPLSIAAELGNEGIVKLLLERGDVDPNSLDNSGRTPLSFAVRGRHEGVVKLLLERGDIDPNPSDDGRTPLSIAAELGDEDTVRLLLERGDIDANSLDNSGRTPLSSAVRGRHEGVVKLLLKRGDIDPNQSENDRTPLSIAAELGDESTVKLLLERGDIDPNSLDNDGRTPLSFAARRRHEGVVKILLEYGHINPNL